MPIYQFKCLECKVEWEGFYQSTLEIYPRCKKCNGQVRQIYSPPYIMASRFIYDPFGDVAEQYDKKPDKLPKEEKLSESTGDFFTKGNTTPNKKRIHFTFSKEEI